MEGREALVFGILLWSFRKNSLVGKCFDRKDEVRSGP